MLNNIKFMFNNNNNNIYNKIFILFILKVMMCNNIFLLLPHNCLANNF